MAKIRHFEKKGICPTQSDSALNPAEIRVFPVGQCPTRLLPVAAIAKPPPLA